MSEESRTTVSRPLVDRAAAKFGLRLGATADELLRVVCRNAESGQCVTRESVIRSLTFEEWLSIGHSFSTTHKEHG